MNIRRYLTIQQQQQQQQQQLKLGERKFPFSFFSHLKYLHKRETFLHCPRGKRAYQIFGFRIFGKPYKFSSYQHPLSYPLYKGIKENETFKNEEALHFRNC